MMLAMDQANGPNCSVDDAQRGRNYDLNRYHDVLPFDHNRVRLDGKHDYINASHIVLPADISSNRYIATQGPLTHSVGDFWRMVWEQDAMVIVMLANLVEAGRTKCAAYWPDQLGQTMAAGDLTITLGSEKELENCSSVTVRKLIVQNNARGGVGRTVTQLHFTGWPDHGVPHSPVPMLRMIQEIRQNIKPPANVPIVVHCSAGVGRSGTFIVVDAAMDYFSRHSDYSGDFILDVFKSLRSQRTLMVQTSSQYFFCYQTAFYMLNNKSF
ncbi:Tyrosine-protein phosphatase non-receptor type 13 [Coemansia sp. RSA 1290]|nr:Tyrosine-protein phosphatase non-receptor type 13 [Coemansia sp. RSA 1290]